MLIEIIGICEKDAFCVGVAAVWSAHWAFTRADHVSARRPDRVGSDASQFASNEPEFDFGDFHLKPLARFAVDGRLLHSKIYQYDRGASLVPIDLAVGWGPMSDQQVLDRLHISQSMRFFWYEYKCHLQSRWNKLSITRLTFTSFRRRQSWPPAANLCVLERSFISVANWSRQPVRTSERGAVH